MHRAVAATHAAAEEREAAATAAAAAAAAAEAKLVADSDVWLSPSGDDHVRSSNAQWPCIGCALC